MQSVISGRIFKFGDNVNSDVIIPGRYLIYIDPEKLSQHAFEMLGDEFPEKIRQFDILVAGANFGCGSAREQAVTAIQGLGIRAVVACSFARAFFRNAVNRGLPIVECPDIYPGLTEGGHIEIDLAAGRIVQDDKTFTFPKLPEFIRHILEAGGLTAYLQTQIASESGPEGE